MPAINGPYWEEVMEITPVFHLIRFFSLDQSQEPEVEEGRAWFTRQSLGLRLHVYDSPERTMWTMLRYWS